LCQDRRIPANFH